MAASSLLKQSSSTVCQLHKHFVVFSPILPTSWTDSQCGIEREFREQLKLMWIINLPSFLRSWERNVFKTSLFPGTVWLWHLLHNAKECVDCDPCIFRLTHISEYVSRPLSCSLARSSCSISRMLRILALYCRNWWTSSAFCIACCWFRSSVCSKGSVFVFLDIRNIEREAINGDGKKIKIKKREN